MGGRKRGARCSLDEVGAGQIVALIGLKNSFTGDTICDPDDPVVLERMTFPEPVISMSIEPNTADDKTWSTVVCRM